MKKVISVILVLTLSLTLLASCSKKQDKEIQTANEQKTEETEKPQVDFGKTATDMFTDRDRKSDYDEKDAINITLSGDSAVASDGSVRISGSDITLTKDATYIISGNLNDGRITVDAPDTAKPHIVLKGADITSKSSAALYILNADKVIITLEDINSLANGGEFEESDNNIDGALFSKQDVTINGGGALTVTSPVGHGIVCKDDLVITDGSITINSASHGIDANDSVRIDKAGITIDSGKDAIKAENTDDASLGFVYISSGNIKAEAEGDGISAGAYMQIDGGSIDLTVGGGSENGEKEHSDGFGGFMGGGHGGMARPGEMQTVTDTADESSTSMKGLKAVNDIMISGGNITVNSADDAIHSDTSLTIKGGTFNIASGDDAIHAEETLTVTGGTVDITESYEGLEALHIVIEAGDIKLKASDDGFNAAGGTDSSGMTGGRDGMFGGGMGGPGGKGGMGGPGGMGGGTSQNSNGSIKVLGGNIYINSSGDGMDANGTLEISGGNTVVVGPTQGDTSTLDYDVSGTISGGSFIGTGGAGMAQSFSDSEQGVVAVSVGNMSAGEKITLKDKDGKIIAEHSPELSYAVVIISTPDIKKGDSYSLTVGSQSGDVTAN